MENNKKNCFEAITDKYQLTIRKEISVGDKIIILLDLFTEDACKSNIIMNNNVICYNCECHFLWQMENVTNRLRGGYPIEDMELLNNVLKVYEWAGEYFILDINTGKVLKRGVEGIRPW
jgi:hypothetical protein